MNITVSRWLAWRVLGTAGSLAIVAAAAAPAGFALTQLKSEKPKARQVAAIPAPVAIMDPAALVNVPVVTGPDAVALNAALAFSSASNPSAQPFTLRTAMPNDETRALECLTQAVYYEAAWEPQPGQEAVAQVILNRVRHPAYPKSVCGVVYQGSHLKTGCQFTFTCDGSLARAPNLRAWAQARDVATRALAGHVAGAVGQATHYHANYVYPYWGPSLWKVAQLGAHIFYRFPGKRGEPSAFGRAYAGAEPITPGVNLEPVVTTAALEIPAPEPTPLPSIAEAEVEVPQLILAALTTTEAEPLPSTPEPAEPTEVASPDAESVKPVEPARPASWFGRSRPKLAARAALAEVH